jgi:polyisoprenoid-binding protein YceI
MTAPAFSLTDLTGDYTLDPTHTRIGFVARHAMVTKVRGSFNEFEGTAHLDGDEPSKSSAKIVVKAHSIDTRNEQRDGHLRTNDFLDPETHPEITFVTTGVEAIDESTYKVSGDLTIKGVTKPISIDFTYEGAAKDPFGNTRVGFEGSVVINRKDYGITWNATLETGGVLVSDKITLEFEVSAIKVA